MERSTSARNQSCFSKWRAQLDCWWKSFERIIMKRPICQKINGWNWSCLEESCPRPCRYVAMMAPEWNLISEPPLIKCTSPVTHDLTTISLCYHHYFTEASLNSSPKWFLYSSIRNNIISQQFSTCATSTFSYWPGCVALLYIVLGWQQGFKSASKGGARETQWSQSDRGTCHSTCVSSLMTTGAF